MPEISGLVGILPALLPPNRPGTHTSFGPRKYITSCPLSRESPRATWNPESTGIHNQQRGDFAAPNVYSNLSLTTVAAQQKLERARLARAFSLSHQVTLTPQNGGGKRAQRYQYTSKSEASETHPLGRGDTPGFCSLFFSRTKHRKAGRDFAKRLYQKELQ
jgi:hypothetical protein